MSEPRAFTDVRFECHADEGYFPENYDDIPEDLQDELELNGGFPCDGGGYPGEWCGTCRFGQSYEL